MTDNQGTALFSIFKKISLKALNGRLVIITEHKDLCDPHQSHETLNDILAYGTLAVIKPRFRGFVNSENNDNSNNIINGQTTREMYLKNTESQKTQANSNEKIASTITASISDKNIPRFKTEQSTINATKPTNKVDSEYHHPIFHLPYYHPPLFQPQAKEDLKPVEHKTRLLLNNDNHEETLKENTKSEKILFQDPKTKTTSNPSSNSSMSKNSKSYLDSQEKQLEQFNKLFHHIQHFKRKNYSHSGRKHNHQNRQEKGNKEDMFDEKYSEEVLSPVLTQLTAIPAPAIQTLKQSQNKSEITINNLLSPNMRAISNLAKSQATLNSTNLNLANKVNKQQFQILGKEIVNYVSNNNENGHLFLNNITQKETHEKK